MTIVELLLASVVVLLGAAVQGSVGFGLGILVLFDAFFGTQSGIVVGSPQIFLMAVPFQENPLRIRMELTPNRYDPSAYIHDILHHIPKIELHQTSKLGTVNPTLENQNTGKRIQQDYISEAISKQLIESPPGQEFQ